MAERKLSKLMNKPLRYLKYRPNTTWVLPEQCVGVEIELENVKAPSMDKWEKLATPRWVHHEDPMLRNNGREFNTSDGLFGEDLFEAIQEFYAFSATTEWQISERTGIHVHLDVSDLELTTTFKNFMCLYLILEQPLFSFIGDDRRNNIHCLPWFKAQANLEMLAGLFDDEISDSAFRQGIHSLHMERYSALNLASLEKYCTVEFRHMKTTLDKDKLITWINLIMSIKQFARDYSGTAEDMIAWAKRSVHSLGVAVFGEDALNRNWTYFQFVRECTNGIEIAEDVITLYAARKMKPGNNWEDRGLSLKDGLANKYFDKHKAPSVEKRPIKKWAVPPSFVAGGGIIPLINTGDGPTNGGNF